MEKELVYLFLYNPMVYQTCWTTQSVHTTRKSAITTMDAHKVTAYDKWLQDFPTLEERREHPFGQYEDWRVSPMILEK